ncbi:MAG TPA: SurA N-terminal domain-containing protein [Steroidobacteraceae bacterium]|nr:SurA N-terminal domain-containing protein [Steroidobacteraceae bacterium]
MLQSIHDKLKGWLAGVVLGIIGLVFVFWGINWTMTAPNYAAKVNGSEVSVNEVRQAYQQQLAQAERRSNGSLSDAERSDIKKRVLDDYVSSEALITRADALGYRVSDAELLDAMSQVPLFQVDGKFDKAHAVAVLRAQGRSIPEIEALFKRDAKLRQLDSALMMSSFATAAETTQMRALTKQQRELAWMTLSAEKYAGAATPDEAALNAYYDAHKSEYMTPETVDLRYVELSLSALQGKVSLDEAQLKAYYEEQKQKTPERFTQPEQRRVSHILLAVENPKDDAAVKAKADGILKRAQAGEDFSKLAKEFSQDPGSAVQGGDLGWSERKTWVAPFADAAFAMKVDEIKGPVKTQFGYHILKLAGIKPAAVKSFEDARAELETEYRRNEAEKLFNNAQDQLADAALQNTTDLDVVARKANLTVFEVPGFSRLGGGGPLGKVPAVIEAAFSQDVLDGRLSPIVEVEKGRGVVLRATNHKLPEQKPLEAVRTEVLAAWKKQRGVELAAAAAAGAVQRLNAGESFDAVSKSLNAPAAAPKFVARADQDVPMQIRTTAFSQPKPSGKPIYAAAGLANGDSAVIAVTAVREEPGDPKLKDMEMRRQLAAQIASGEAQSYAAGARAAAKVVLNPQAIE